MEREGDPPLGAAGVAVQAGYDLAKEAADRVVAEVTSALASGRTVIVNGVITASSTVVAGATEAAESYLDWVPFFQVAAFCPSGRGGGGAR